MRSATHGVGVERTARQIGFSILAVAILRMAAVTAHAVPLPPIPPVPACQTDTLANYMALTKGCMLGGFTFTGFTYTFPGGVPAANQITLTPVDSFTEKPDGFDFTADPSWSLQGMGPSFYSFSYFVFGKSINAAAVSAGGSLENQGSYEWDENLCLNGLFDATGACIAGMYDLIQATSSQGASGESTKFGAVDFIDVATELTLSGKQADSTESTFVVEEQFAQAPEPPSIVLLMIALAATPSKAGCPGLPRATETGAPHQPRTYWR
jgi:hypothetical protein